MNINKIILLILAIVYSCEYHTDETYYRNVSKNVALPDLSLNLNLTIDTIYVYNYSNIKLSLKLTNKTLYAVNFYLDGAEIEDINKADDNNYSFMIDMSIRPSPVKLRVEIYTSTGTGSIADKVNAESFVYTKEWVLIYYPDNPKLNSEVKDGRLKLSWTPIKNSITGKYYISTSNSIDSTVNNWYIDSSYFGGQKYISVYFDDNGISGYGIYGEINYSYPKVYLNNRDSFLIYWEKCKFYNNIKGYRIRIDTSAFELQPLDTIFVYKNGLLGNLTIIQVDLLLKDYYKDNSKYFYFGDLMGYYPSSFLQTYAFYSSSYFPLTGNSFYYWSYVNNVKTLFKFSLDTKSIINSTALAYNYFSVSPNNKYIICDVSNGIMLLNSDGFGLLKSIPTTKIISSPSYFGLTISDIGTSVFYDYLKNSMIVYDVLNDTIVDEIPISTYVQQFKISANGQYIFESKINALYKIDNNSHIKVWSNESNSNQFSFFEFSPDNQNQIALYDGALFYIKSCSDFSTITSFSLNNTTIVNVDFDKKKILTYNNFVFYVYSLTNGSLLNSIRTNKYILDSHLFNDYIFLDRSQLNLNYQ